jgi:signal transduction histidine kinase
MASQSLLWLFGIAAVAAALLFFKLRKKLLDAQADAIKLSNQYERVNSENSQLNKVLREHLNHQWDAVAAIDRFIELEQNRIAHELHDDTVQRLVVLRLRLEQLHLYDLDAKVATEIEDVRKEIDETIRDIRFLIKGIPVSQYQKQSLTGLIRNLYEKLQSILVRRIELQILNPEFEFSLDAEVKMELFRIVQEAAQNALKHSIGSQITIKITWADTLTIDISDDGIGSWTKESGTGTTSMQQRATRIGAKLKIINSSRGMYIAVTLTKPKPLILN